MLDAIQEDNELKALQYVQDLSEEFGIAPELIRPCIAFIYYEGVDTNRDTYAFILAQAMNNVGASDDVIRRALTNFNARLSRPLKARKLDNMVERVKRYDKLYRCDHAALAPFCIGEICPYQKAKTGKGLEKTSIGAIVASPWPANLTDGQFKTFMMLHRLRMLRGLPANAKLIFNFTQLNNIRGGSKSSYSSHLKALENFGLIKDLNIGSAWGVGKKGNATSFTFVYPLPAVKGKQIIKIA
jgi:hypothetical protein